MGCTSERFRKQYCRDVFTAVCIAASVDRSAAGFTRQRLDPLIPKHRRSQNACTPAGASTDRLLFRAGECECYCPRGLLLAPVNFVGGQGYTSKTAMAQTSPQISAQENGD